MGGRGAEGQRGRGAEEQRGRGAEGQRGRGAKRGLKYHLPNSPTPQLPNPVFSNGAGELCVFHPGMSIKYNCNISNQESTNVGNLNLIG